MNIICMLIAYFFTMAEYLWLARCLDIKVKNYYFPLIGLIALPLFGTVFSSRIGEDYGGYISIRFVFFLFAFFADQKNILKKLESTFIVAIMKDCIIVAAEVWIGRLIPKEAGSRILDTFIYFFFEFLAVVVFGLCIKRLLIFLDKRKLLAAGNILDFIIIFGSFEIFTCIWWAYTEIIDGRWLLFEDRLVTSIAAISLLLLEINIVYRKWLSNEIQKYADALKDYHKMESHYYRSLLDKEADTRKYRHDMNNHMICIKNLLEEGRYDQLGDYIDNLYDKTRELVNRSYNTGNNVLDALTNYYADNLDEDIEFKVCGTIHKTIDIDDVSLSSIYSNMLLNAIEEQQNLTGKDKFINVILKEGDKFAQIAVINSMSKEQIADLNKLSTSKKDKHNHGFGLKNIRKNIEDNNGKLDIEARNHRFDIKVTLPVA